MLVNTQTLIVDLYVRSDNKQKTDLWMWLFLASLNWKLECFMDGSKVTSCWMDGIGVDEIMSVVSLGMSEIEA